MLFCITDLLFLLFTPAPGCEVLKVKALPPWSLPQERLDTKLETKTWDSKIAKGEVFD